MRTIALVSALAAGLHTAPALAGDCPAAVPFEPQDRLADLAARCGVTAGAILRTNGVSDEAALRQAGAVAIPQQQDGDEANPRLLERAQQTLEDTAEQVEGMATRAREGASDFLSESELGRDLRDLGQSAGLLAAEDGEPGDVQLGAAALDGGRIRIAATGLAGDQPVTVVLVQGEETVPLQEMTTEPDGTLLAEIVRPETQPGTEMQLALQADGRRLATAALEQR
ncbi:hypothetical protein GCM10011402_31200 [Paracoccus acridae]|uniref:LysM domain-containing protein n=1 Tax=Paracoccus acridae TaxID=1795310 RepID=A0ABQ1VKQ1_9RHOB|nr:hypothetical protein [Paracoccus acridae]GGF76208.1 hypothetical protein GCM10011402_31200 [Paracoccus acridae]